MPKLAAVGYCPVRRTPHGLEYLDLPQMSSDEMDAKARALYSFEDPHTFFRIARVTVSEDPPAQRPTPGPRRAGPVRQSPVLATEYRVTQLATKLKRGTASLIGVHSPQSPVRYPHWVILDADTGVIYHVPETTRPSWAKYLPPEQWDALHTS